MKDQSVFNNYEHFWKEIVENPDGSINKEQLMKELHDFTTLINSLGKLYSHITGGVVSKPMTRPDAVLKLFKDQLEEQYDIGYADAMEDMNEVTQ